MRQLYLESLGLRVIRFDDDQVKQDMDGVLSTLDSWIENNGS